MYTLYYNKNCKDCERQARRTTALDWLGRFEVSTEEPPSGPLDIGEIAVLHNDTGKVFTGGYASRKICLNIPAYFLVGLFMFLPPIFKLFDNKKAGCNGDVCSIDDA